VSEAVLAADGFLRLGGLIFRAAIGKGGRAPHKQEGDGATPVAMLPLRRILYRADRIGRPKCAVPLMPLAPHDGWCDDPADRAYNTPVRLPYDARHEELWRNDGVYDVIGVLGWNDAPVLRRQGSAIFLHVARHDYAPTEGCVALALPDLLAVLAAGLTGIRIDPV
jgi:L,D-peptidoglycan transpeptidase YkuD (ErfK/YbiS/YcfS/YnhG family)